MIPTTRHLNAIRLAVFLVGLGAANTVCAQETTESNDTNVDAAFELYDQAKVEFNEGRFEAAIDLLDEAFALHPEPILIYNLARAYEGLGEEPEALAYYEDYLEADPDAENRGAVEGRIQALRESASEVRTVETEVRPGPWILLGSGAAVVLSGLIPGARSRSSRDDAGAQTDGVSAFDALQRAERQALTANLLFGIGGGIAVAGLVWAIIGGRRPVEDDAAQLEFVPGGIRVRGAF